MGLFSHQPIRSQCLQGFREGPTHQIGISKASARHQKRVGEFPKTDLRRRNISISLCHLLFTMRWETLDQLATKRSSGGGHGFAPVSES
jgi:hypothetical protein